MNDRSPGMLPDGWRWSPPRRRGPLSGVVLAVLLVLSAGVASNTYDPTAANYGTSLKTALNSGSSFTEWNSTRNILRTEVKRAIGIPLTAALTGGPTGKGIDVAVIDTGVAPVRYLDSAEAVVNGPDLSLDRQLGLPTAVDAYGHGTHLAGIIAGRDAGVAPGSRIVNLKVGAADGAVDVSQVIAAIDWVVTHRADPGFNIRVINLAYGTDSTQSYLNSPLTHAVESAWRAGIVVVVASGNSGGALAMPATDPFVLTVGAADINDPLQTSDDVVAPYSAVGTTARGVDLLAPGTSITSLRVPGGYVDTAYPESRFNFAGTTYAKGSGTSQAAAVVSGVVALVLQAHPEMNPDQVKALLKSTARPLAGAPADAQGAGLIDVAGALAAKVPSASSVKQRWKASTGTGPLEASRGDAHLVADDGTVLAGEIDLLGQPWKGSIWAPLSTTGTAWKGGTWNGNVWAGTDFEPSLTVDGVVWTGRTWRSATWTGRTWRADLWLGHTWYGRTWRSDGWA